MSQIQTKFITDNAVNDLKQRLRNNQPLRGRNAADSGDISVLKVDSSDIVQLLVQTQIATSPSAANDVVNKAYVDALIQGLKWKEPVRAISTSNITLSGAQTIDGVSIIAGDRVLVAGQSTGANNGIYVAASGAWSRATDADASSEILQLAVFVSEGTSNADTGWVCTTDAPITLGSTSLVFVQFTGTGSITAGAGLTKTGSTIDVIAGDASLLVNADELHVRRDPVGAVGLSASGVLVNTDGTSIEISSNNIRVASGAAGNGLGYSAGVLSVNVGSGIQISADTVVAKVDGVTIKVDGSSQLQGLINKKENFTLAASDVTNQYVDLSQVAATDSMMVYIAGTVQAEGADYSLAATGGAGGKTRVSFLGDLATGGGAALVAGDILRTMYQYL